MNCNGGETSFPTGRAATEHIRWLGLDPATTDEELANHMRAIRRRQHLTFLGLNPTMSESEYHDLLARLRCGQCSG
jgi:hypothetical protein